MHDIDLVLAIEEEAANWFSDLELYLLQLRICGDESKLNTLPLVLQGKAKACWFEGLKAADRQSLREIRKRFIEAFWKRVSPSDLGKKLSKLKQDVSEDFALFWVNLSLFGRD
ncbi:hypothetical protein GOP47_0028784 [Adiantum capillus-veneris]|nr:hypothetical protein GOP47_0028784 [Adiantum capillus-veneris]